MGNGRCRLAVLLAGMLLVMAAQAETLRVGYLPLVTHGPTFIARAQGYFAGQDLGVELVRFQAAQPMSVAIASGDVDIGITALTGSLVALAERGAVRVIGGAVAERPGYRGQQILASKAAYEGGLTHPRALAGHRFGTTTAGSSFHYMAHRIADAEGITRDQLRLVPLHRVATLGAALRSGQIDAWAIVPNVADRLTASDDVRRIGAVVDYLPDYQVTVVFAARALLDSRPAAVRRFLKALGRGIDDYNAALVTEQASQAEQQAVVAALHPVLFADRSRAEAETALRAGAMWINPRAALNLESIEDQLHWLRDGRMVPAGASMETLVDKRFLPSSLSDLGDRREPSGAASQRGTGPDSFGFEARSGATQRKTGQIWAADPAGAADQSQVRQTAREVGHGAGG